MNGSRQRDSGSGFHASGQGQRALTHRRARFPDQDLLSRSGRTTAGTRAYQGERRIRETVLAVVERRFPTSREDDRRVYWPEGADPAAAATFRPGPPGERDHADIPLAELAGLARRFTASGATAAEVAVLMARELGLGRLREATRARFEAAAGLAAARDPA